MIKKLTVKNFRIFQEISVNFEPGVNIILGKNGAGKTSILEAIYFLSFTKSFKAPQDADMVRLGEDYFQVCAEWTDAAYTQAQGNFTKQQGKRFIFDNETLPRMADVIGSFPIVFQSPEDFRVTSGPSAEGRLYLDRFIAQNSRKYLSDMMLYRRVLKNRNAHLKSLSEKKNYRYTPQLEVYDLQLSPVMYRIVKTRKKYEGLFNLRLSELYAETFNNGSYGRMEYKPSLNADNEADFNIVHMERTQKNVDKEIALRRTLWGPNYDKYIFYQNDTPLIHYASQGEHKIWMTMLKLAEGEIIKEQGGQEPVFLFDDLFAELDINNSRRIIEKILKKKQALITTTDLNDLRLHGIDTKRDGIHITEIKK